MAEIVTSGWLGRVQTMLLHRRYVGLLLAMFIALRLFVAFAFPVPVQSDAAWYVDRAREIIATGHYAEGGIPTAYWPVGFPFILSCVLRLIPDPQLAGITINLLAGIASVFLILWIGRKLTGREDVGRLAALLFTLYPAHILYTGQLLTEPVYITFLLLGFGLLTFSNGAKSDILAGLVFGLATYIKSQTYLFPVGLIVALWLICRHIHWRRAIWMCVNFYVTLFAVIVPWSARNTHVFGSFVMLSTNGGPTLYDGNNPLATGGYSGFPREPEYKALSASLPIQPRDYVTRQVEFDALTKKMAVDWIKQNPGDFIKLIPRKFAGLWGRNTDALYAYDLNYPQSAKALLAVKLISLGYYLAIVLGGVVAAIVAARAMLRRDEKRAVIGLLFAFPAFTTLIGVVFSGQSRFNLPCMPFLMLAVSWLLLMWWPKSRMA